MEFEILIASVTAISVHQSQVATDDKLLVFHSKTQLKGVPLRLELGHSAHKINELSISNRCINVSPPKYMGLYGHAS